MPSHPYLGRIKTPDEYEAALLIVEGFLLAAARSRTVITYKEINEVVSRATGHQLGFNSYGTFLEDLVRRTHNKYGVILSALVVSTDKLLPGEGFYALAAELNHARPGEAPAESAVRLRAEVWRKLGEPLDQQLQRNR